MEELKRELNQPAPVEGDGRAAFFEDGTEDEYEDFVKNEDLGWRGFIKKVFNPDKQANDETNSN